MKALNKYCFVAWITLRSNLAYFGEVSSRLVFLGVILFIFLRLWQVTYGENKTSTLGGLSLSQMLWYLTVTEAIILSGPLVTKNVDSDVRTGSLSVQLTRPFSYPLYCLSSNLGERLLRFLLNLVVGAVITLTFVGPIEFGIGGLSMFFVSIPFAFVLDFLIQFLIGLGAFWMEDTSGIFLIYSRLRMILGGIYIPIELFPDWTQPLLKALPFSSLVYGPAHLFVHPELRELLELMVRQGIAILIVGLAVWFVFRTALRRLFVNGG